MGKETQMTSIYVPAGNDKAASEPRSIWGLIPLSTKISSKDTNGSVYLFEHANMGKGGPPRHFHYEQDEWFYAVKGEFAVEIGEEKYRLKPGDSIFAPRMIPHAWACISDKPGTLITLVSPAGTFETFLHETTQSKELPPPEVVEKHFAAHKMKVVGPPLKV